MCRKADAVIMVCLEFSDALQLTVSQVRIVFLLDGCPVNGILLTPTVVAGRAARVKCGTQPNTKAEKKRVV